MIGNDLLPPVFVEKIDLHDNHIVVKVNCYDRVSDPAWSDHVLSMENFKIMLVSTGASALITSMGLGHVKMDPKVIKKIDPNVKIDILPVNRIESYSTGTHKVFTTTIKHPYELSGLEHLYIYAALVVDPIPLSGARFVHNSYIHGPIAAESVFSAGQLSTLTNVFTEVDTGEQWHGPVHSHSGTGWMAGSEHGDYDHEQLEKRIINNLKLKDMRTKSYLANRASGRKNNITEISELYNSFSASGLSNNIFFLNPSEIISKNTKFGTLFSNLNQTLYKQIVNNLRFRMVAIDRHKVKTQFLNNRLKSVKNIETKRVLTAHQQAAGGGFIITHGDVIIRKTIFPFDEEIFSYEFAEAEMTTKMKGEYKYSITFAFTDPTIIAAQSILDEIQAAVTAVEKYCGKLVRHGMGRQQNTNSGMPEWKTMLINQYSSNPLQAPWVVPAVVYAKYKKMFFRMSEAERRALEEESINKLEPTAYTVNTVNDFKKELKSLYSYVNEKFGLRRNASHNFNKRSRPKAQMITNLISKKYEFSEIIKPSSYEKFYTFIQQTQERQFTKQMSLNDFKVRMMIENNKFFKPGAANNNENTTSDIGTSQASYFSPFSVMDSNGNEIELTSVMNIDKEKLNEFFDNVPKPRSRLVTREKNNFVVRPYALEEPDDPYINAKDYLGRSSTFVGGEPDSSVKVLKANPNLIRTIMNKIRSQDPALRDGDGSRSATPGRSTAANRRSAVARSRTSLSAPINIFNPRVLRRAPMARGSSRRLIPNQLRALNSETIEVALDLIPPGELEKAENEIMVSVNYLTLRQIETLVDFKLSRDGVKVLKNPIWDIVTTENLDALSVGSLCRIEEVKSPLTNFEANKNTLLPNADKYFILTDSELASEGEAVEDEADLDLVKEMVQSSTFNTLGASSVIVEQNVTKEEEIFRTAIITPTRAGREVVSKPPVGGYTGGGRGAGSGTPSGGYGATGTGMTSTNTGGGSTGGGGGRSGY